MTDFELPARIWKTIADTAPAGLAELWLVAGGDGLMLLIRRNFSWDYPQTAIFCDLNGLTARL